jgi:hypothetical protein
LSPSAKVVIDDAFHLAPTLWGDAAGGDQVNLNRIRVATGNVASYGRYVAHVYAGSGIIEIPCNRNIGLLRITDYGYEPKSVQALAGTVVHELGHVYQHELDPVNWQGVRAGNSTHTNPAWVWICYTAWTKLHGELPYSVQALADAVREDGSLLTRFSPYRPIMALSQSARAAELARVCAHCGTAFEAKRITARFCSSKCRSAAYRADADGQPEAPSGAAKTG